MARLSEGRDVVKFARLDVVSYEGEWDPETYDPYLAKATLDDHIDEAVEAEKLGWDAFLLTEHHFDGWTLVPSPNIMLTAIAMRTSRIRLGHAVQVLPVHNPFFLAEQYGMLDVLSGGRLEVGLGRGNFDFEWDRYEEDRSEAVATFDDNLTVVETALSQGSFTHDGVHRVPLPSALYPRPIQDPLPMWLAASSPESVKKVARRGHNLLGAGIPDDRRMLDTYLAEASDAGYERSGANYGVLLKVVCAPTDHEAERISARHRRALDEPLATKGLTEAAEAGKLVVGGFADAVAGSPQTVLDHLASVVEGTGAQRLLLSIRLRGIPGEASRQTQRLIAEHVFPKLRNISAPGR